MVYRMLDEEGIYLGASSALNVAAAVELAKVLGAGSRVVTILCDGACESTSQPPLEVAITLTCSSAAKYQSRLFSKSWLQSKGLYDAIPAQLRSYASLQ